MVTCCSHATFPTGAVDEGEGGATSASKDKASSKDVYLLVYRRVREKQGPEPDVMLPLELQERIQVRGGAWQCVSAHLVHRGACPHMLAGALINTLRLPHSLNTAHCRLSRALHTYQLSPSYFLDHHLSVHVPHIIACR